MPANALPCAESLALASDRILPFWNDTICPAILENKNVIVVAHGNTLKTIVKYLSGLDNDAILKVNIPTAVPLVYEFDQDLNPVNDYYLLNDEELKRR